MTERLFQICGGCGLPNELCICQDQPVLDEPPLGLLMPWEEDWTMGLTIGPEYWLYRREAE